MKIIFMGTPDFSVTILEALKNGGHEILCVYTQPPRKSGRGQKVTNTPVHQFALEHDLPVRHPSRLKNNSEEILHFKDLKAHMAVVVAYGLILPQEVLDAPTHGCLNIHASLLPRWRGAAPIQRSIESGDQKTGISIMQMDAGLDTGDIILQQEIPISTQSTAGSLHDELSELGAEMIVKAMKEYAKLPHIQQDESLANYAHKISKNETKLDFANNDAQSLDVKIRAFSPYPATFFEMDDGNKSYRIKIISASCEANPHHIEDESKVNGFLNDDTLKIICKNGDYLVLHTLQKSGKKVMSAQDFIRGSHTPPTSWTIL